MYANIKKIAMKLNHLLRTTLNINLDAYLTAVYSFDTIYNILFLN
jgi:hypothetical protein